MIADAPAVSRNLTAAGVWLGLLGSDLLDIRLWLAQGIALLLAVAVIGQLLRLRHQRRILARLVVDIGAGSGWPWDCAWWDPGRRAAPT